jgi:hypothetical protein
VSKRTLTLAFPLEKEGKGLKNTFTPHYALLSLSRNMDAFAIAALISLVRKSEPELVAAQVAQAGSQAIILTRMVSAI